MAHVDAPESNGHSGRRLVSAGARYRYVSQRQARGQAGESPDPTSNLVPSPPPTPGPMQAQAFGPAPVAASPSSDGSSMDVRLYARVIWRFKFVMAVGLIIGIMGAYMLYEASGGATYSSHAQVFITQPGFTWGQATNVAAGSSAAATGGTSTTSRGNGNSALSPYVPGVDPQRLSSLASLYAQLASGTALRSTLPVAYRNMLNPASGTPKATLYTNAVNAAEFATPAILPVVSFSATAPTASAATGLAASATNAFQHLVTSQQAGEAPQSRVVAQLVQTATPGKLTGHKSKSLPILVFLAAVLGAFGLSLLLENTRPRPASGEPMRGRIDPKRRRPIPGTSRAATGSPSDAPAEDVGLAEPI